MSLSVESVVVEKDFDYSELSFIRDSIEVMTKFNQVEILRILTKYKNVTINENKYGIHINLTELNNSTINELKMYINYVNTQEIQLKQTETEKETFKNTYFFKETTEEQR